MRSIWNNDTWVRPYLRRYGRALVLALTLGVAASLFACSLMFTSGYMITLAAALPLTVLALHLPSLFVRIFGIGKPLLRYGERLCSHDWALRMTSEMRRKLYMLLQRQSSALGEGAGQTTLGSVLALLTDDIGHVQNLVLRSVLPLLSTWLLCLITLVACAVLSWQLLAIMAATLIVIAVIVPLWSAAANTARVESAKAAQAHVYDGLTDDIVGITDWILSGRYKDFMHRLDNHHATKAQSQQHVRAFERYAEMITQAIFCLCIIGVLIWAGYAFSGGPETSAALSQLASLGSENAPAYPPNWIAAFVLFLFPLMEALAPLPDAAIAYTEQSEALRRLNKQEDAAHLSLIAQNTSAPEPPRNIPSSPSISFDALTFGYEDDPAVLNDISLEIPFGENIALTGRSGAGKTTLAKLIHGDIRPQKGTVSVGGQDPATMRDEIHHLVGVLEQQPKLFDMTLRDNLLIGNPNATDEELIAVIDRIGLHERFAAMDQGLDSWIQEGAFNLSGGEAHRIALARMLLAHQPIVILDEPFASLDPATERSMLDEVLHTFTDKTVVVITHSPQTLDAFARVLTLNDQGILS